MADYPRRRWGAVWLGVLLFLSASSAFSVSAEENTNANGVKAGAGLSACVQAVVDIANTKLIPYQWPRDYSFFALRSLFFPFFGAGKFVHFIGERFFQKDPERKWLSALTHRFKNDWKAAVLFLLMSVGVETQATTFATLDQVAVRDLPSVVEEQSVERPRHIVLIDGFWEDQSLAEVVAARLRSNYRKTDKVALLQPRDSAHLLALLKEHSVMDGPIDLLEIHGHGVPGQVALNLGSLHVGAFRVFPRERAQLGLSDSDFEFELYRDMSTGKEHSIPRDAHLRGVFSEDALLLIYSCEACRGEEGQKLMGYLHQTLMDGKGQVAGVQTALTPSVLEYAWIHYNGGPSVAVPEIVRNLSPYADKLLSGVRFVGILFSNRPKRWHDLPVRPPIYKPLATFGLD